MWVKEQKWGHAQWVHGQRGSLICLADYEVVSSGGRGRDIGWGEGETGRGKAGMLERKLEPGSGST